MPAGSNAIQPRTPRRNGHGKQERTIYDVERDRKAAELRARRLSYSQIGRELSVSASTAHLMVQRAMMDVPSENVEQVRLQSLMVLDEAAAVALQVMRSRNKIIGQTGRVVLDDETHEPLYDPMPNLAAIDKLLKIEDLRARLVGSYAPRKQVVSVISEEFIAQKRAEMMDEILRRRDELRAQIIDTQTTEHAEEADDHPS